MEKPNYVARRSAWTAVKFWRVVLFFLIIPLIIMIVDIIIKKHDYIEFYDDHVVSRTGWLNTKENRFAFMGIYGISINQTFWQKICNYGDIRVDVVGRWDISTNNIAKPKELKAYLDTKIVKANQVNATTFN